MPNQMHFFIRKLIKILLSHTFNACTVVSQTIRMQKGKYHIFAHPYTFKL